MVVILKLRCSIFDRGLEQGCAIVDVVGHGNAAGGGKDVLADDAPVACPAGVVHPLAGGGSAAVGVIGNYMRSVAHAERGVAKVANLGRIHD